MAEKIDPELKVQLPLSGSRGAEKLGRLKRRMEWLKTRIAEADANGKDLTFDKAEVAAIEWVMERMPALEQQVFKQTGEINDLEEALELCGLPRPE